jgi:drug/metabolite transporter (DMT)-like permease
MDLMTRNVALLAMVVAGAAWGAVFVAPGLAPLAPALLLATGRFVAFGAVSLPQIRRVLHADVPWGRVIAHALTGSVLYYALVAVSVRLAGPTVAVATIGLVPVVMALVSARGTGRVAGLVPALGLVALGQVLLHVGPGQDWSLESLVGLGLAVLALVSWSWYGLDSHKLLHERPDIAPVLAAAQGLAAGALALPAAGALLLIDGAPAQPLRALAVVLFLGLVSSWLAVRLWHAAAGYLSPVLVSQLMALETAWGFVFAAVADGAVPAPLQLAGEIALVGGVVLAVLVDASRSRRAVPAPLVPDDGSVPECVGAARS